MKAMTQTVNTSPVTVFLQVTFGTVIYFAFAAFSLGLNNLI